MKHLELSNFYLGKKDRLIKNAWNPETRRPSNFFQHSLQLQIESRLLASNKQSSSDIHVLYVEFWRRTNNKKVGEHKHDNYSSSQVDNI